MILVLTLSKAQEAIATNLRKRRLAMGLTQQGLARRAGVSLATLRKFEQKRVISLESFLKLAMVLDALEAVVKATEPPALEYSSIDEVLEGERKKTAPQERVARMNYSPVSQVTISLDFGWDPIRVGTLARSAEGRIYFEYAPTLSRGLKISPLRLPPKPGLITFDPMPFEGLPGVFYDSLPDGWGRLLLDRFARSKGITPGRLTPLDRLSHVGQGGMGALVYEPDLSREKPPGTLDIDDLALKTQQVLGGSAEDVLEELVALNGSSAGARPKAMISINPTGSQIIYGEDGKTRRDYAPWLVKFPNTQDGTDAGAIEYVLFPYGKGSGGIHDRNASFSGKRRRRIFRDQAF